VEENGFALQPWVCQTCLPKKTMFSQNSHLHNGLHPLKKKKKKKDFQNGLEKSIFSILTNQDTQLRSQVKVHNNNNNKTKDFRVVC
jgi:hypothetical protein